MLQALLAHALSKRQLQIPNGMLQAACVGLLATIISSNVFLPLPAVSLPGIRVGPKIVEGGRKRFKGSNRPSATAAMQMSGEDRAAPVGQYRNSLSPGLQRHQRQGLKARQLDQGGRP